jgi:hypothetical protein
MIACPYIVMKDECTLPDNMGASTHRPVALQAITRPELPFVPSFDVARTLAILRIVSFVTCR